MMQPIFTTSLVRELRGSPLTVLVAFLLLEQSDQVPVTAQLLKDITGYGDHTITDSLRALESPTRQIVSRVTGGWRLSTGFQLPLEIQNRDIRGFQATTTTTLYSPVVFNNKVNKAVEEVHQNREKREFANPTQETIYKILGDSLIGEPVRTRLSISLDDPVFVLSHCIKAAVENIDIPLLIHRLRMGDGIEETFRRQAQDRLDVEYIS